MTIDTAFTHFPTLTTERLYLRPLQPTDAEAFFAIKSDEAVTNGYSLAPHQSIDDTHAWIQRLKTSYERRESLVWCFTFKGKEDTAIGACTFWNFDSIYKCAELGYELSRDYWRQGIATEAIRAVLAYGFTELEFHRVEANPFAKNTASRNLLLKVGFSFEGNLRERHFFRGQFEDQHYYGLLKDEWLKSE